MTLRLSGGVSERLASEGEEGKSGWRKNREEKQRPIRMPAWNKEEEIQVIRFFSLDK